MSDFKAAGFIGLGVMGEPICLNLVKKSGLQVMVFDLNAEPLSRLAGQGAIASGSVHEVVARCDVVFVCLPSASHVKAVFDIEGLSDILRPEQLIIDLGTTSVAQTREFFDLMASKSAVWVDAPIARTRQAAQDGTLSVMVGAAPDVYAKILPLIRCFASDVTNCGLVGTGQVAKILNNMVLFETVNALAEAVVVGKRSGIDPAILLETFSKGSADSFALRNHGMKAILPGVYPSRAFSTKYALKDLSYALELADDAGVRIRGAELMAVILQEATEAGSGDLYFPVVAQHIPNVARFEQPSPTSVKDSSVGTVPLWST
ncbi:NAD(P)-dependent oxidoreductase [Ochrobactrum sp. A-1]|uniref:NAD(P)-dependent oxidoreductase n=1 Tax=Ochrobactrum sp. A-1 TaxID=2920940 RepID=UPI001F0A34CE|nr:NAD(P)-dependent oxidoreductase [Ochrobactrum sp. A-1]